MSFIYNLPDEQLNPKQCETDSNALVIIGANGAGKSKLGAWIEQQDLENIHRIGAQRNLNFNENITLKSYSQAEDIVFWGTAEENQKNGKGYRWEWGKSYTTKLMNDFEDVLAALIALKNNENDNFVNQCKKAEETNNEKPHTPVTSIDKLSYIWNDVFPQRDLLIEDSKFYAFLQKNGKEMRYSANQMSDGERSVLYLASQVLCVPKNKILIIDEPEIHLHRSIMNRLWKALEKHRQDCLFIYITHDTQFAAMHGNADKIWIQDYDGEHWKFKKIEDNDLPEELLLEETTGQDGILKKGQFKRENILIPYVDYKFKRDSLKGITLNPYVKEKESVFELGIRELLWQNKIHNVQIYRSAIDRRRRQNVPRHILCSILSNLKNKISPQGLW